MHAFSSVRFGISRRTARPTDPAWRPERASETGNRPAATAWLDRLVRLRRRPRGPSSPARWSGNYSTRSPAPSTHVVTNTASLRRRSSRHRPTARPAVWSASDTTRSAGRQRGQHGDHQLNLAGEFRPENMSRATSTPRPWPGRWTTSLTVAPSSTLPIRCTLALADTPATCLDRPSIAASTSGLPWLDGFEAGSTGTRAASKAAQAMVAWVMTRCSTPIIPFISLYWSISKPVPGFECLSPGYETIFRFDQAYPNNASGYRIAPLSNALCHNCRIYFLKVAMRAAAALVCLR